MPKILLNDILGLRDDELDRSVIKFNQWNGTNDPMEEYTRNPSIVNDGWFLWHKERRYFREGQIGICFLKLSSDTWLLTTIKEITKCLDVVDAEGYEAHELAMYRQFFGRVIIKHRKSRPQGVYFKTVQERLEVLQILPAVFDGIDFPGYDKVRLSYEQLSTIIHRNKRDWVAALENQKAVYLITDRCSGKHYVGSAYGENGMLFQRWTNYVNDGHGGNKLLKEVVEEFGIQYVERNFQYAILENYNARVDKQIILGRESWWKETLGSRAFGLNAN